MSLKAPPNNPNKAPAKVAPKSTPSDDGLPTEETDQTVELNSLKWLAVAPPGWGKTELFSLFPDCLMLACEEGHKFVKGHKLIISEWGNPRDTSSDKDSDGNIHCSFTTALKRITESKRFQFPFIDTIDALIKKCIDHHLGTANQTHLSDLGEYGKGYDLGQNDPIRRSLNDIFATGRGLGLITHQNITTSAFKKGPVSKKETSLPNGIHKIIFPQMDVVIHGEFGAIREGQKFRDRIVRSEGSEDILAKNRGGVLPPAWILPIDKEARRKQMLSFFEGTAENRKRNIDLAYAYYLKFYEA